MSYQIDKSQGPHAASGLSDQDLEYLLRITALELALRMDDEDYVRCFTDIAQSRAEMDEMIDALRKDRDRMLFIAAITRDLESLPLTTDSDMDDAPGMYL